MLSQFSFVCFADEVVDYSALFQEAANTGDNDAVEYGAELSETVFAVPIIFIKELTLEDPVIRESVSRMVANYNKAAEGNAPYIQFVLPLFANEELTPSHKTTLIPFLLLIEGDLSNATPEFVDVLFDALPYSDGMAADYCSYLLCQYFLHDRATFVRYLAARDTEFQELAISMFVYGSWGNEAELGEALSLLLTGSSMLPEEHRITAALLDGIKVSETQPQSTPNSTNPPSNNDGYQATSPVHPIEDSPKSTDTLISPLVLGCVAIIAIIFGIYVKMAKKNSKK